MRYYLTHMARQQKTVPREPLRVVAMKLTGANVQLLQTLSQDAADALGWPVRSGAVLRALLQYVAQQPPTWAAGALHPLIEEEIAQGRVWGSKQR